MLSLVPRPFTEGTRLNVMVCAWYVKFAWIWYLLFSYLVTTEGPVCEARALRGFTSTLIFTSQCWTFSSARARTHALAITPLTTLTRCSCSSMCSKCSRYFVLARRSSDACAWAYVHSIRTRDSNVEHLGVLICIISDPCCTVCRNVSAWPRPQTNINAQCSCIMRVFTWQAANKRSH